MNLDENNGFLTFTDDTDITNLIRDQFALIFGSLLDDQARQERRLFYVDCTRAKERLYITYPRFVYTANASFPLPSRFLIEIEKDKYFLSND